MAQYHYRDSDTVLSATDNNFCATEELYTFYKSVHMKRMNFAVRALLILVSFFALPLHGQQRTLRGQVLDDATGETMVGVSVEVKDTGTGAITDLNGRFEVSVSGGSPVLVFSYVGYRAEEINVGNRQDELTVRMEEDNELLDEVVVIGYGTQRRKDVTTAIASVSTKDLDERPVTTVGQALQGKAAGVYVMQPNGTPGADMSIRVRGTTSFNGSNAPLYVVDGVAVDDINFLSPNDIASMQVLKDASSAAIYGSRAANGVVMITTKAGETGKAKVTLSAQVGINKVAKRIESLNAMQYKELQEEVGAILNPGTEDITDWHNEVYQRGLTQSYQVAVSNATDKFKYYLSAGYMDEQGVLKAAFFRRYNFRANLENEIRKWLKVGANISYSDNNKNGITTGMGANRGGVVLAVVNLPTSVPVWDEANNYYNRDFYGMNLVNPVEAMDKGKNNKAKTTRLIASGNATFTFLPELWLKSSFTLDRRNYLQTSFTPPVHLEGIDEWGSASDNRNMNTVTAFDNVLTYQKAFDKHRVEGMAGTSYTESYYTNSWINGSHFRNGLIHTLNVANKIAWNNTGSDATSWGIMSYFARLSYNFDGKYMLTANVRRDGSSKLHPDHRWGTFPSVSAAWRLSSEKFMERFDWLDDMKIRVSWGQTGNQSGVGDYAYLQRYNVTRQEWFTEGNSNALPTISQANLRNQDLTWETTTQTDVGLDFSLFNSRVNVTMDYYYKRTTDMLMYVSLPAGAAAANNIVRNEGEMTNRGFEFTLSTQNFRGVFNWSTDFNISVNRNRLESLELQQVYYGAQLTSDILKEYVVRNEPGRSLGGFYGYISNGVDPQTGELMYRDLNKDGIVSALDRTYIGDPNPDFTYGMTNTLSWKGFTLSFFLQGTYGNDIYNASRIETECMQDGKNQSVCVLKRWREPGQVTDVPKAGFAIKNSSYFVEDGSYLRLKNLTFSYNFTGPLLKRWGVMRLQPYFTANNLFTLTGYSGMDPEVNEWGNDGGVQGIDWGSYPQSRSFVFGVNVEF